MQNLWVDDDVNVTNSNIANLSHKKIEIQNRFMKFVLKLRINALG